MFRIRSAHTLENNFRSTRRIASVAQALIEGGEEGMRDGGVEGVRTTRSVRGDGDKVGDRYFAESPRRLYTHRITGVLTLYCGKPDVFNSNFSRLGEGLRSTGRRRRGTLRRVRDTANSKIRTGVHFDILNNSTKTL